MAAYEKNQFFIFVKLLDTDIMQLARLIARFGTPARVGNARCAEPHNQSF